MMYLLSLFLTFSFQFEYLLQRISPLIETHSNSPLTISAETKLLAVLDFLATGEFQRSSAQKYGFVQKQMSSFIGQVTINLTLSNIDLCHVDFSFHVGKSGSM